MSSLTLQDPPLRNELFEISEEFRESKFLQNLRIEFTKHDEVSKN